MNLAEIQPSQLFISSAKLSPLIAQPHRLLSSAIEPVPVKRLNDQVIFTDGPTRAFASLQLGLTEVRAVWDEDELDWEAYGICVEWCRSAGIFTIADLKDRILSPADYEALWVERCRMMHRELRRRRSDLSSAHLCTKPSDLSGTQ